MWPTVQPQRDIYTYTYISMAATTTLSELRKMLNGGIIIETLKGTLPTCRLFQNDHISSVGLRVIVLQMYDDWDDPYMYHIMFTLCTRTITTVLFVWSLCHCFVDLFQQNDLVIYLFSCCACRLVFFKTTTTAWAFAVPSYSSLLEFFVVWQWRNADVQIVGLCLDDLYIIWSSSWIYCIYIM